MYSSTYLATLALASLVLVSAKTDLKDCTSSETVVNGGASLIYYLPDTGEICSLLDCGGGRAPPKTTVPGCAQYEGTATYTPDFLSGYATAGAAASSSAVLVGGTTVGTASSASETGASTLAITSAPALSQLPTLRGTGTGALSSGAPSGGNNVTGTATLSTTGSPSAPVGTGAADMLVGVGKGVVGLAVGVVGLAML